MLVHGGSVLQTGPPGRGVLRIDFCQAHSSQNDPQFLGDQFSNTISNWGCISWPFSLPDLKPSNFSSKLFD